LAKVYNVEVILEKIKTGLAALVTSKVLRLVKRGRILPSELKLPALGLLTSRLGRDGGTVSQPDWSIELLLWLRAERGSDAGPDSELLQQIAEIDAALEALNNTGTLGGVIDGYVWDPWYAVKSIDDPGACVGAIGRATLRINTALMTG